MRKILRHFQTVPFPSRKSKPSDRVTAVIDDWTRLPTELLILIASHVEGNATLATLCRVSKTFRVICLPRLYRTVQVSTHYAAAHHAVDSAGIPYLYRSLRDTQVSLLVTELRVILWGNERCARRIETKGQQQLLRDGCTCGSHDNSLGNAVLTLHNLQTLEIQCNLCSGAHAHDFLLDRDMPKITMFIFCCYGSGAKVRGAPAGDGLLTSASMRTITALSLRCGYDKLIGSASGYRQFIRSADFMPRLSLLGHDGTDFCNDLLAARPVERLCVFGRFPIGLHRYILQSPGRLSHLFMMSILRRLRFLSAADWSPYRHLKHIGTITFSTRQEQKACDDMRVFAPLNALETMEINHMPYISLEGSNESLDTHADPFFVPTSRFFALLDEQHPRLRRVLLVTRSYGFQTPHSSRDPVLWEKKDGWKSRMGPTVKYWDMLCDTLDII